MVSIGLVLCTCGTPQDRDDHMHNVMVLKNYGEYIVLQGYNNDHLGRSGSAGKYILLFFSLPVFVYVCV